MMEKIAHAGEGGGSTPTPFQPITITYNVAVYAPAERADTLPVFHLCTLWDSPPKNCLVIFLRSIFCIFLSGFKISLNSELFDTDSQLL
jgi:hypothetical protein